ncbi:MAG: OmpA family protein [Chitinophagaceae bacterium]|nr:OmpA family protein [Chitinophagaceae bacterium]
MTTHLNPDTFTGKYLLIIFVMNTMKNFLLLIIFLITAFASAAQGYDPNKVNKKAAAFYNQAIEQAQSGKFAEGITLLDKAIQADAKFVDAYLSKAGMYGEMKDYKRSVENYEKSFALDSAYSHDYKLPYSINLAGLGNFEKAIEAVDDFIMDPKLNEGSRKAADFRRKCYQFALEYQKSNPVKNYVFAPQNLGDSINSEVSEYYPSLTIDGKTMVYTRRVRNFNEDFYVSEWKNNNWSKSENLSGNINTEQNEGAQNISQDGQWLIFTGCNFPDGYGNCDLYYSILTRRGWSEPQNLGRAINTEFWESAPSLSPDKQQLYFASRAPGGYGGIDIYVSHRLPDGRWSVAENMGPGINTAGDESCPFLHADNQTLYFTSNGWLGYGGDDLFVVRKQADGTWGKPENLGYPINTIENEGSLVIASDGKTAYYASDRADSKGGLDIYTFEMRENVRPLQTLWIKGKVFDKKTGDGLPSAVELIDLSGNRPLSKVQTDEEGNYLITLPVGKDYAFNVNRKGYLFYSENFPLSQRIPDSTYRIDIPLQPIEINANIVLKNIFFETGKFDLKPESTIELDKLIQLLTDNPTLKIQIGGHTDNVGKPADNLALSNNRAKAVVNYLSSKGITAVRLSFKGFGETKPLADNKTEEGRAQNRRTELVVTGK